MSLTRLQELVQKEIEVVTEEGWADCCCVTDIGKPSWKKDAVMDFIINLGNTDSNDYDSGSDTKDVMS
jgi:hypothetical protein